MTLECLVSASEQRKETIIRLGNDRHLSKQRDAQTESYSPRTDFLLVAAQS